MRILTSRPIWPHIHSFRSSLTLVYGSSSHDRGKFFEDFAIGMLLALGLCSDYSETAERTLAAHPDAFQSLDFLSGYSYPGFI